LLGRPNDPLPTFLSTRQLSALLGISTRKLERDRQDGTGLPFVKLGRRVLYPSTEIEAYVAAQLFVSTAEARRAKEGR
jgi:excisionase family DNA binding protein